MPRKFTKEEVQDKIEALSEIMNAMPRNKVVSFFGHFNDIFCFLELAKKHALSESEETEQDKKEETA